VKKAIRVTVEYYNVETNEVLESDVIKTDYIHKPEQLKELGYLHSEQIQLLATIQNFKIKHQATLCNDDKQCPLCGKKSHKSGIRKSKFHAALTDHEVLIQRRSCRCGWSSPYTVEAIYGSSIHPDLLEKQAIQGAENSYRKASKNLNAESCGKRSVNSIESIRKSSKKVACVIGNNKLKQPVTARNKAEQLIVVIDGGHLKAKDKNSRSFEAMITAVYRPENIRRVDKYHHEIIKKTCVASALSDHQQTIKTLSINACRKEGAEHKTTKITCLTDGANNCWSIAEALKPVCSSLTKILDWFHITKRFTVLLNIINEDNKERLEKIKWHLWHGDGNKALLKLSEQIKDTTDDALLEKLEGLYRYISKNQNYLVNYQERHAVGLHISSTFAEITVNNLINSRQKRSQKMQWSREGAHNVLQIRTSLFSKTWNEDWTAAQSVIYKQAV